MKIKRLSHSGLRRRMAATLGLIAAFLIAGLATSRAAAPHLQPLQPGKWPSPPDGGNDALKDVEDVAASGNYACVANGEAGLQVIDIRNPAAPVRVGGYDTPGVALGVAVSGKYAYVADYSSLEIIDVSNPGNCVRVGGFPIDESGLGLNGAVSVAVSGNYAYIAAAWAGLLVIDVNDPTNCVLAGSFVTGGQAFDVAVSWNHAYLAATFAGLQVIDVSNPTHCVRAGEYPSSDGAFGVAVSGNLAYVADGAAGLHVIDVSDPARCARVGGCETCVYALDVAVVGNHAYVAAYGELQVVDVGDPTNCAPVGALAVHGVAWRVAVADGRIYVANSAEGLQVLPSLPNVQFAVRVDATPGVPFTIEAATNLGAPMPWSPIFTTNVATMPFDYVDFDVKVSEKPRKYYRVVSP